MLRIVQILKSELIAKYYSGRKAREYEATRAKTTKWPFENDALESMFTQFCALTDNIHVIDLPVGTNRFHKFFNRLPNVSKVHAVDLSADMLSVAKSKECTNYVFHEWDIVAAPLGFSANVVVCFRFLNLFDFDHVRAIVRNLSKSADRFIVLSIRLIDSAFAGDTIVDEKIHLHREGDFLSLVREVGFEILGQRHMSDGKAGLYYVFCLGRANSFARDNAES